VKLVTGQDVPQCAIQWWWHSIVSGQSPCLCLTRPLSTWSLLLAWDLCCSWPCSWRFSCEVSEWDRVRQSLPSSGDPRRIWGELAPIPALVAYCQRSLVPSLPTPAREETGKLISTRCKWLCVLSSWWNLHFGKENNKSKRAFVDWTCLGASSAAILLICQLAPSPSCLMWKAWLLLLAEGCRHLGSPSSFC
jgi:hypothetical protein